MKTINRWLDVHPLILMTVAAVVAVAGWVVFALSRHPTSTTPVVVLLTMLIGVGLALVMLPRSWESARRVETIVLILAILSVFLNGFSVVYWSASTRDSANFANPGPRTTDETRPLSKTDAIYFTLTVFTTTGFGDIRAQTDESRKLVAVQMALGVVIVTLLLGTFVARLTSNPTRSRDP